MKTIPPLLAIIAATVLIGCSTTSQHREADIKSVSVKTSIPLQATKVDPNEVLIGLEGDITDLMAENDKQVFNISPVESDKLKPILLAMYEDITKLHGKYNTTKTIVDAPSLYKEIEATLNQNEAGSKSLILSLKKKGFSTKSAECENFCWESCGHNSVGEWVCFLTCRRHCT
jgi:hypothetical protein